MSRLLIVSLLVVLGAGPATAKDADNTAAARRFLKVESSTWDWFGIVLRKDGHKVGPEFFGVVPSEAIRGSIESERHARRARIYQGFSFGFGVAGFGLLMGSYAARQAEHRWSDTSLILGAGGLASILGSFVCAMGRDRAMLEAVNAYNYDLVSGALRD